MRKKANLKELLLRALMEYVRNFLFRHRNHLILPCGIHGLRIVFGNPIRSTATCPVLLFRIRDDGYLMAASLLGS